jgi:prolipoprotein diacylglyceryltransferase
MGNKNTLIIACILILIGLALIFYGISYNNSTMVQLNNGLAGAFNSEKDYFGTFCIAGGLLSGIIAIILFFKSNR